MKKILLLFTLFICIAGCSFTNSTNRVLITQTNKLPPFKTLVVEGDNPIELINGPYSTTVTGFQKNMKDYTAKIVDQTLYVRTKKTVNLQVSAYDLKNIIVKHHATLSTKNFRANHLNITTINNGSIQLDGLFNIDKISQHGSGRIDIKWISSNNLTIISNANGPIYLAGIANNVTAKLTKQAQLEARYLRAKNASIFTTDHAKANVLSLSSLKAFAVDNSQINYYKRPVKLTTVTKNSGNILHPGWLH